MRELPSGTVTFLFTDVEGSTRLLHELGAEAYAGALAEHRRKLRAAFDAHDGVEVDTQGDAFFVAFPTAPGALAAAAELTEALAGGPISVRVGVHTGTPFVAEEGYVGVDVHRAARIAAAGHGAQVLVSSSTATLVDGFALRDLGEHRFKDLAAAERVFQLGNDEFPPLKTLFQTNLPVPATPFLGRERELGEVGELLARTRLLTLTGPGGGGKTRLALQAAGAAADEYPQGVWWVPLAAVVDPASILDEASRSLGAPGELAATIGDRRLLLVLDNFEHLIDAAPALSELLAGCANLDLLVTSRERLRIAGENVYPVPVLARAEARELFSTRARAVSPDFTPDAMVDLLCERLDDLPLALELAAARTVMLSSEQLLERLGSRLDLLRGGRDAESRQQTLRATIEWSHDLLELDEQRLFARLAVFAGGCTLEAAEAVCGADLDTLQSLVEKSLVRVRDEGRFWMLETIRELALERLAESGEEEALRRAHAKWFFELARRSGLADDSTFPVQRHDLVIPEGANLRAAIHWAEGANDADTALTLAVELELYWATNSPFEGARILTRLLESVGVSPRAQARGLRCLGGCVHIVGDYDASAAAHARSLAGFEQLGDEWNVANLLHRLALVACARDDPAAARTLIARMDAILLRFPVPRLQVWRSGALAHVERLDDNNDKAIELYLESARGANAIGYVWWEAVMTGEAAEVADSLGRATEGRRLALRALELCHDVGDRQNTVWGLATLAALERDLGNADRGAVLWGAVEAEERRGRLGAWEQKREPMAARLADVPRDGVQRGHALTLDEAVAYALSVDSD